MAREPSGCSVTLAYVGSFLFACWVWSTQLPYDSDSRGLVTFLGSWGLSFVVLLVLPSIWEALRETVRLWRRKA